MKFVADFHIHSHYSRATSKELIPEYLHYWARLKGITIVGTGDFTHPGWVAELKEKLEPAEQGLFKLKKDYLHAESETPFLPSKEVRFILTAEISNIYKKNERVRKVHNVVFAPGFEVVERIQQKLTAIKANITSDGRPILGLDSRDLLEMVLDADEHCFFVPAHIWTPWFSVLGSKSGFDSIAQCFDDLAGHIYAVETGLSTDPPMNWMCGFLDNYTLTGNSDAHSPERLGRNANRFQTELSYDAVIHAMKTGDPKRFLGSIDLFPQEGKYHYDGHRKCGICWDPVETLTHDSICLKCGKPVTVGVMNRVVQLSDREDLSQRPNRHPFQSIIPLKELLGELAGVGPNSRKVDRTYMDLLKKGVPELELLMETPLEDIKGMGGEELAEAIKRMRNREIYIQEGFDGEYGVIKVFAENERPAAAPGKGLFKDLAKPERRVPSPRSMIDFDLEEFRRLSKLKTLQTREQEDAKGAGKRKAPAGLNPRQQEAIEHFTGPALVIAGPGTGKTRVLTYRVLHLIEKRGIDPGKILAVTFTNKAAAEIDERLQTLLKGRSLAAKPDVTTFHALGFSILREQFQTSDGEIAFSILEPGDKKRVIQRVSGCEQSRAAGFANAIEAAKQQLKTPGDLAVENPELAEVFGKYLDYLKEQDTYDLEDLLYVPVKWFEAHPEALAAYRERYRWILIDEYQDINYAQYQLIRGLMPEPGANLCIIGDPDQAIYGFRGADVRFIRRFREDYPEAAVYRLQQSYRCSDSILKASGNVMQRAVSDDTLLTGMEEGIKLKIVKNSTYKSEAEFVARTIEQMMGGLRFFSMDSSISEGHSEGGIDSLSDFVVLCRVKGQMEALEKAFIDHSIPYQTVGEEPFFKQEPIASILDLLKFSCNPQNMILKDKLLEKGILTPLELGALKNPAGNGQSVKDMVIHIVDTYFIPLKTVDHDGPDEPNQTLLRGVQGAPWHGGPIRPFGPPEGFFNKTEPTENAATRRVPFNSLELSSKRGIEAFNSQACDPLHMKTSPLLRAKSQEPRANLKSPPGIKRLLDLAENYGEDLGKFLQFTALGTAVDTYRPGLEHVTLMTLHGAKGLEFKAVFIVGCEEGLLPYSLYKSQSCDREEERRLLYVGMTRAKKFLFLSHAEKRFLLGREYRLERSSFLNRIERELIELSEQEPKKKEPVQRTLFDL